MRSLNQIQQSRMSGYFGQNKESEDKNASNLAGDHSNTSFVNFKTLERANQASQEFNFHREAYSIAHEGKMAMAKKGRTRPMTSVPKPNPAGQGAGLSEQEEDFIEEAGQRVQFAQHRTALLSTKRRIRPWSSKISTRFTKSSLSKNKKFQHVLEKDNSQTQSVRQSQLLFLRSINASLGQQAGQPAPGDPFKQVTTSAQIVRNVTYSSHKHGGTKEASAKADPPLERTATLASKKESSKSRPERPKILMRSMRNYSKTSGPGEGSQKESPTLQKMADGKCEEGEAADQREHSHSFHGLRTIQSDKRAQLTHPLIKQTLDKQAEQELNAELHQPMQSNRYHHRPKSSSQTNVHKVAEKARTPVHFRKIVGRPLLQKDSSPDLQVNSASQQELGQRSHRRAVMPPEVVQRASPGQRGASEALGGSSPIRRKDVDVKLQSFAASRTQKELRPRQQSLAKLRKVELEADLNQADTSTLGLNHLDGQEDYKARLDFAKPAEIMKQIEKHQLRAVHSLDRMSCRPQISNLIPAQAVPTVRSLSPVKMSSPATNRSSRRAGPDAAADDEDGVDEKLNTRKSPDGQYWILDPTLSLDNGPNCKDKVYNQVRLEYLQNDGGEPIAETRCYVEIPVIKPKPKKVVNEGQDPRLSALKEQADTGPPVEEWSLPVKFIIRQSNFKVGREFKKPRKFDIFLSQQTQEPSHLHNQMHSAIKFNFKSKNDYDKEYGISQVYQFVFGKEHLERLRQARQDQMENKKPKAYKEPKYPRQVFITIRGVRKCDLDIAAQLTLQPEPLDEQQLRLKELQKAKKQADQEALEMLQNELTNYFDSNAAFFKIHNNISETNFILENVKKAEHTPSIEALQEQYRICNYIQDEKRMVMRNRKVIMDQQYRADAATSMERWDKYRQDKEELIKKVIQTLKNLKRTKQWIVLIKRQSMMAHTNENYMIHRDYIIQVFASLVIAIKFKVRIFVKLQKRYGFCYCKR